MTDTTEARAAMTPEIVEVVQEDREEAWPFRPAPYRTEADWAAWMAGIYDHIPLLQAFARHRIAALTAARPAIMAWQPIETAPRDETRVMLGRRGQEPWFGFWSNWNNYWTTGENDRMHDHVMCNPQPTHWQPLPAPPVKP